MCSETLLEAQSVLVGDISSETFIVFRNDAEEVKSWPASVMKIARDDIAADMWLR